MEIIDAKDAKYADVTYAVGSEFARAQRKFPPFASFHEGYAILLEEVEELWTEIKTNPRNRNPAEIRNEAIQVAAMALRFLHDLC